MGTARSAPHFDGQSWWDLVRTLADDKFEGRNTGSAGERGAQELPLKVLTVYGLAESDRGERVTRVAAKLGYSVQPDSEPLRNLFIRSDQYSFIKEGIPRSR